MEKKTYQRKRGIPILFMVDEKERNLIDEKMKLSGIKSIRAYLLKQAVDGRVINVELDSIREMVRLLSNATNNINQIARRVNHSGSIYAKDIEVMRGHIEELWSQTNVILKRLSELE